MSGSYWWWKSESTWMLYDLGRWDELLEIVETVRVSGPAAGGLQALELSLPYRALVLARRGELDTAREVTESVLVSARVSRDLQLAVPATAVASLAAFDCGDVDAALAFMGELLDVSRDGSDRYRSLFLAELTRMCVLAVDPGLAAELGREPKIEVGRAGAARTAAAATLAEAEGRLDDALLRYTDAARRWREVTGFPGAAAALPGSARCLIALERPGAEAPLAEACELFSSMGHRVGLAETDGLSVQVLA